MTGFAPLARDLLAAGIATLAFDERGHGASIVGPGGPVVVDAPEGLGLEAFGTAFMASAQRVEFARIENDVLASSAGGPPRTSSIRDGSRWSARASAVPACCWPRPRSRACAPSRRWARPGLRRSAATGPLAFAAPSSGFARRCSSARPTAIHSRAPRTVARWSDGLAHVTTRLVPGAGHAMAIYFEVRDELLTFLRRALGTA